MSKFPFTVQNKTAETLAFSLFFYDKDDRLMETALLPGGEEVKFCSPHNPTPESLRKGIMALPPKSKVTVEAKDFGLDDKWNKAKSLFISIFRPTPGSYELQSNSKFFKWKENHACLPRSTLTCGHMLEGELTDQSACLKSHYDGELPGAQEKYTPDLYVGPVPKHLVSRKFQDFEVNDLKNPTIIMNPYKCLRINKPIFGDPKYEYEQRDSFEQHFCQK